MNSEAGRSAGSLWKGLLVTDGTVKKKKKKRKNLPGSAAEDGHVLGTVRDYLVLIAIALSIAFLFTRFIAIRSVVEGSSMNPTLTDQDNVLVSRITYTLSEPERFDVVVFELRNDPGTYYIKRIIGLPGETVTIRDGEIYINGVFLAEDIYGNEPIRRGGRASASVTLGEDEYFVMGDNRNNSQDSRYDEPGNILKKQLIGKVLARFWPLSSFTWITHQ